MKKKMTAAVIYKTTDSSDKPVLIGVTDSLEKAERIFSYSVYEEAKKMYEESGLQPEIFYWDPGFVEVSASGEEKKSFSWSAEYVEEGEYAYLLITEDHRQSGLSDIMLFKGEDAAYSYFRDLENRKGVFEDLEDHELLELEPGDREKGILPHARLDEGKGLVDLHVVKERIGRAASSFKGAIEV